MNNRKTLGLALGSGGVKGLAHIGVIRTLLKHNIPIDYIAGSSIGSWVGAHFALYQDIEKTADFTAGKKKEKLYSFLEPNLSGGLVKGDKLESLLNDWLGGANFADVKIPFKVAATDLLSGKKVIFNSGKLSSAVRASISVPGFLKPVFAGDEALVDAGISNPVPVDLVKDLGAEIVLAVNLDFFPGFEDVKNTDLGYLNVADGVISIMRHHLAQYSCRGADFIIEPPLKDFSSWSSYFINNNDQKIIALAEEETEKIIPQLKEKIFGV